MKTMQWSDVARSPREVAAAVDSSGEVRLERRGDAPLVVMRADRMRHAQHGLEATGRLLRKIFAHAGPGALEVALIDGLPWTDFLPAKDRRLFAMEFVRTLEACSDLDVWAPLGRLIDEWQATASVHAEHDLAASLSRASDADLGPVPMPMSEDGDAAEEG